ncbi:MAG: UDP-N-acetylmuramoyl-L-alanine--D-glutamate ligase, partial [Candidatus Omnitrophica bacterium]|nr:UDP-N-acetylmuramoyl-L-alanine--D-glutamate ligase [Candidatus Omnitrophota bacterium]
MMKKIATVVGLGVSGFGAALLLSRKGWKVRVSEESESPEVKEKARILAQEDHRIVFEIGRHTRDYIEGSSLVVTSPGATDSSKPLVWARELNIPVIDEIELGYRFCPARIIAVTGTNGKSTTVTLIGEILRNGGCKTVVCGNIGQSFCEKVANISGEDIVVLEVSSFQLERTDTFRPYVSLFLNITQNHLDRHRNFNEYLKAKLNIFKNQKKTDWVILNYEDKNLKGLRKYIKPRILYFSNSSTLNGAHLRGEAIYIDTNAESRKFLSLNELPLKGEHNLKNYMAALLVAHIFEIDTRIIKDTL